MALSTMVALLVILGLLHSATATQYTVGLSGGWTFQTGSNSVYTDQFQNTPLFVGDTLLFPFTSGVHNVYEIPPSDLASCNFGSTIQIYTASNSVVTLTTQGTHAFACQIPGHCSNGMQLSVTVTAAPGASPSSSPTAAPESPPTATPVSPSTAAPVSPPTAAPVSPPTAAPVSPPTAAPVTTPTAAPGTTPIAAPVTTPTPAPAPATTAPGPAPTSRAPAPTPGAPTTAPTTAPTPSTGSVPVTEAPAPAPAGPGDNGSSIISSGSAMVVAAVVAGFAFLLV